MYCDIPKVFRCCFCLPLRKGVTIFGYVNILFSVFMVTLYSYSLHEDLDLNLVFHGVSMELNDITCITIYCMEMIFNVVLVYGSQMYNVEFLKIFYFYAIATTFMSFVMQIITITNMDNFGMLIEAVPMCITGLCIHIYLIILVRSLIIKLGIPEDNAYDNQLQQIVNGDLKFEENGVPNEEA